MGAPQSVVRLCGCSGSEHRVQRPHTFVRAGTLPFITAETASKRQSALRRLPIFLIPPARNHLYKALLRRPFCVLLSCYDKNTLRTEVAFEIGPPKMGDTRFSLDQVAANGG
jgi:hypothetical protein